ncbi:dihydrodipicolinate synthase family protein [Glutamicibacter sp. MNS18]|uniref:dihydrodipicolinate synthase family protein n=1 Tax=Glutamicibacter sp. MNS18 TaxID=2989817 RepID=UPI0022363468|nr:dihydrodipicolinate synthase family protein [Glutamicibacter sp. MNS18]MCW4466785.1 dihydrodipicolinate synthase family protein [Glutamicibacter sp. MNS18]
MSKELSGILTALATPFDQNGEIDDNLLTKVVDRSVDAGLDAVVVGGGTGEVSALSFGERVHLFQVVADHTSGKVPVVANVGALTSKESIKLSHEAQRAGADVLMLITPYYEQLTHAETAKYIKDVASSVELPIMLYNNPSVTGVNLDADTLAWFGRKFPNIKYVKDSSKDWEQGLRLIQHYKQDIGLIVGWDSFVISALVEGAAGVMAGAANVVPTQFAAVAEAIRDGRIDRARQLWSQVFPVVDALLALPFAQAVKAGMRLQGFDVGQPREPLLELPSETLTPLKKALEDMLRAEVALRH